MTPADLRALSHEWAHPCVAAYDIADALRQAADEIEKCQQLSRVRYEHAVKWQRERDTARRWARAWKAAAKGVGVKT